MKSCAPSSASIPQEQAICVELQLGTVVSSWTEADDGMWLFNGKLFVPDTSPLWHSLVARAHDAGHEGIQKTLHQWCTSFFNAHALRRVHEFMRGCTTCQRNMSEHPHPGGLLHPLLVPSKVWSEISMDFVEAFP